MPLFTAAAKAQVSRGRVEEAFTCCLHVSADLRTHQLIGWEADALEAETPGRAGWTVHSLPDPSGARAGTVCNAVGVACRWALLGPGERPTPEVEAMLARRGGRPHLARLLSAYPMRPLLVTFAVSGDLCPEAVETLHRVLLAGLSRCWGVAPLDGLGRRGLMTALWFLAFVFSPFFLS